MIDEKSSLTDVAFAVCTALANAKTTAVLTGGSAATFYAPEAYQSLDLDFVLALSATGSATAIESIGFRRKNNFYVHPRSRFSLDFPPGPLAVGEDLITDWATERRGEEKLFVLHPFDSCRDRLASWLFWNDFSGLEQALAVHRAQAKRIKLSDLKTWARREGHAKKFELYEARYLAP